MTELLTPKAVKRIMKGKPYDERHDPWTIGYWTRGDTYIIASNGKQTDSQEPNDLAAITYNGSVIQLRPTTNPELLLALVDIVATVRESK